MITDTIQEVTPKIVSGAHKTWSGKDGEPMWTYNVKFSSGEPGEFNSKSNTSPFDVGQLVEITDKKDEGKYGVKYKLRKYTENKFTPGSKSTYNDPKTVRNIAAGMAQSIARLHFELANVTPQSEDPYEDFQKLCDLYYNWIIDGVTEGDEYRDQISRRYYTLQLAVECIKLPVFEIKKSNTVIAGAERLLLIHQNITHVK